MLGGDLGPVPPFWRVPLFGDYPGSYRTLLRKAPDLVCRDVREVEEVREVTEVRDVTKVSDVTEVSEIKEAS